MNSYTVKYQRPNSTSVLSMVVRASSASQAKEQIKSRFNGDVKIISCVERQEMDMTDNDKKVDFKDLPDSEKAEQIQL